MRKLACVVVMLLMLVGATLAEEYQGKLVKFDAEAKTITINVNEKDVIFDFTADSKLFVVIKGEAKELKLKGGKGGPKTGTVTLKTEKKDGKEIVIEARFTPGKKN